MNETVRVNDLTLCHKHSDGFTRSTLPDMCRSPTAPAPYTNVALARDLAGGTTTVFSHNGAMNGIKGSRFAVSTGDEPGVGLGVKSGTIMAEATWLSWSPNVFMQGRPVTRLTDKMLMNHGNTISAGGFYTGPVAGWQGAILNYLCFLACICILMGTGRQSCVKVLLDAQNQALGFPPGTGLVPEANLSSQDGMPIPKKDGTPNQGRVPKADGTSFDVVGMVNYVPFYSVEMKFEGDRFRGDQDLRQRREAGKAGIPRDILDVPEECDCDAVWEAILVLGIVAALIILSDGAALPAVIPALRGIIPVLPALPALGAAGS